MNDPGEVAFHVDEKELAPAAEPLDPAPPQPIGKISLPRLTAEHPCPPRLGLDDPAALEVRLEAATGSFDFGKLRHDDKATVSAMIAFFTTFRTFGVALRRGLSDPQFRALSFLVVVLLASGTVFYWRFEDWTVLDSLYFSVITLTTVGYGDLAPTTAPTKIFTIVYVLIGLGILVSFLSLVAGHAVEARMERADKRKREKGG